MDVIGSFMTRNASAERLRLSQRNLSLESSQREVVTDSPVRVDFPSRQLTLHGLADAVHANCLLDARHSARRRLIVLVIVSFILILI